MMPVNVMKASLNVVFPAKSALQQGSAEPENSAGSRC
jgi:hypothetical protein